MCANDPKRTYPLFRRTSRNSCANLLCQVADPVSAGFVDERRDAQRPERLVSSSWLICTTIHC